MRRTPLRALATALTIAALGCTGGGNGAAPAASGSAASSAAARAAMPPPEVSSPAPVSIPVPADKVLKVIDPKGSPPYAGAAGTVTGRVTMKGDPAPDSELAFPPRCAAAAAVYGKLWRVGQDGELADALVTVTGYDAFVPAKAMVQTVTLRDCALSTRTIALTFGQHLEVANKDATESYMPFLDGAPYSAIMVAIPNGAPVKLYPEEPGHYLVRDELPKPFLKADVFVLKYATHDVTGLDGRFKIEGVPVGKVRVDAFLPALKKSVGKELEVHEGDNTLDFELTFDAKQDAIPGRASPSASPSAKGAPSARAPRKRAPR
ncbi:MAG TPA: hypothetical protein VHB21_06485 [Minicystis sp.]|nr:hypothetical protein [Minicystis sp.]